ncbi:LOW QUALITY PROTEIN: uncharacterized protein LOC104581446 [Brachypodium distachyon]|uniref:LOW QUALITY PROTEIN: uncharacterized protein LOC104581446 n=1 Tax=Brachypodium distachyon TaxID=15368 RepID=UPI000D0DA39E|nr:LOW QUALITY PROTEIN: uncharacterized protein LOC104581446 [Brachypodium distachyon]|eukprot:XP_024311858.1 LOW QUALITY PROTEIN: uncharacterized protein LOC104581446 [Brachypodium distachyon]
MARGSINGKVIKGAGSHSARHAQALGDCEMQYLSIDKGLRDDIKSVIGKLSPTTHKILWEGTIQLDSCRKETIVACFESGEKIQDIQWPKSIVVKGRVKLEDFEKFVKELPPSRSRIMMVISLHEKVGSSKVGLKGTKEAANSFEQRQRVGFAEICEGCGLYVCPRSDHIIKLLDEYGFYKCTSTTETNQDSLIGFVVWNKPPQSYTSKVHNSVEKTEEIQGTNVEAQDFADDQELGHMHPPHVPADQVLFHQHHRHARRDQGFIPHRPPNFAPQPFMSYHGNFPNQQHLRFGD